MNITHDWDEEDYEKTLETAFGEYRKACYGDSALSPVQGAEVKQAFLSGIHWLNTRDSYCPDDIERALRAILGKTNPFIESKTK